VRNGERAAETTHYSAAELDAITTRMEEEPGVAHATWESSATA
jgi:hypothetical protein